MNEVVANAEAGYAKKEEIPSIAGLATEEFVQTKIEEIEHPTTDLTGYATETYVSQEIAKAQLEGAGVDVSNLVTQGQLSETVAELEAAGVTVDGKTIIKGADGSIATAIGGCVNGDASQYLYQGIGLNLTDKATGWTDTDAVYLASHVYSYRAVLLDYGTIEGTFTFTEEKLSETMTRRTSEIYFDASLGLPTSAKIFVMYLLSSSGSINSITIGAYNGITLKDFTIWMGADPCSTTPIDARFIPVDNETITIVNGKLTVIGASTLSSSEEVPY
jgi:hypothetical protein